MVDVNKAVKTFLRDCLDDDRSIQLYDNEIERLLDIVEKGIAHSDNVAVASYLKRLEHNPREKAFHDIWLKWNTPMGGINNGNGILQDLFINGDVPFPAPKEWEMTINERDRRIVATVIQWLGTNVGIGFLSEALEAGGQYRLQAIPRHYEEPATPGQA